MIFFVSDTHFYHTNVIKYSNRPFKDVNEMNEQLITNWNSRINTKDIVYHLGDFSFRNANAYRDRLNGHIGFIMGNHDASASGTYHSAKINKEKPPFIFFEDVTEVNVNGQKIFLSHYAHRVWNKSHHGVWHLYGHSHGTLPDDPNSMSFDCGVDCHNYAPLSFEEVKTIMAKKIFKPKDHHGRKEE